MPINSFLYPGAKVTTAYEVANSLRFDDDSSHSLTRTFGSGNQKTWTWSAWVKKTANLTTLGDFDFVLFNGYQDSNNRLSIFFGQTSGGTSIVDDCIAIFGTAGGSTSFNVSTSAVFRDNSAWMHIVVALDTTQSTASNRVKIYVNGVQQTLNFDTTPAEDSDQSINFNQNHTIGNYNTNTASTEFDGYMAEVVFIDGSALDPTSFGEFDSDSPTIWKPKDVSGLTFGTNGFYLDFEDSSALGNDVSGNDNDFTANNIAAIDQSTDTCTNNFSTLNPLALNNNTSQNHGAFSEGNLKIVGNSASNNANAYSTIGFTKGKWYMEAKVLGTSTHYPNLGIVPLRTFQRLGSQSGQVGSDVDSFAYLATGNKENNGTSSYGDSFTTNDIIGIAADLDNGAIYFSKNGTFQASGDPTSGSSKTNAAFGFTVLDEEYFFGFAVYQSASGIECNFGSSPYSISSGNADANGYGNFEYSVPSGYYALNTKNLAEFG